MKNAYDGTQRRQCSVQAAEYARRCSDCVYIYVEDQEIGALSKQTALSRLGYDPPKTCLNNKNADSVAQKMNEQNKCPYL